MWRFEGIGDKIYQVVIAEKTILAQVHGRKLGITEARVSLGVTENIHRTWHGAVDNLTW